MANGSAVLMLPVVSLSAEQRADLLAKRDSLKAAMADFTPATHKLFDALDPQETGGDSGKHEQVTRLRESLHAGRCHLLGAIDDACAFVRAAMRAPLLDFTAGILEKALEAVVKSKIIRRAMVRRSPLYRDVIAALERRERFDLLPVETLHGEAQILLNLCDAVLRGDRLGIDPATNKLSVISP